MTPKKKLGNNHRNKRKIKKPRLHTSNQTNSSNEVPKFSSSTETQPSSSTDEPPCTNQPSLESNQTSSTSEQLSSQASINQSSGTGTSANQTEQPRKSNQICRFFQRNRCAKGYNCPFVHQLRERKHYNNTSSNNSVNHSNNNTSTNSSSKSKPSLLEKVIISFFQIKITLTNNLFTLKSYLKRKLFLKKVLFFNVYDIL